MISRMLLAGCVSVVAASAAQAADFEAPAAYDWSGVYGGIFAGVGFSSSDWRGTDDDSNADPVAIDEELNDTAAVLGALAGINVQHDRLVFGLEADIAWFGSKEDESLDGAEGLDIVSDVDLLVRCGRDWAMHRIARCST